MEFFRQAPESPGVYLMRDRSETVLYVGKAKNLRKRLASYRIANPDRMRRRHLRLLRAVERIELQPCSSESSALARESALVRSLRPSFNRAGTWPGNVSCIVWTITGQRLGLAVKPAVAPFSDGHALPTAGALPLCSALARSLWCAFHPDDALTTLPEGWFSSRQREYTITPSPDLISSCLEEAVGLLRNVFAGEATGFTEWIRIRTETWKRPFDLSVREADLETVSDFAERVTNRNRELEINASTL